MVCLSEITAFLEDRFPKEYAEDYDNAGYLLGYCGAQISAALLCLDVTVDTVREAAQKGAQLIISHHPIIFSGIKSITDATPAGGAILLAIQLGIGIYSAHTNADSAPDGLSDYIAKKLDLAPIGTLSGALGRMCVPKNKLYASELCAKIKKEFSIRQLYTTLTKDRPVNKIALVNGGGGGDTALLALKSDADIYISGDLKHHEHMLFSSCDGKDFIEMRHYDSEFCVTSLMKELLDARFKNELQVFISHENKNPLIDTDNIM